MSMQLRIRFAGNQPESDYETNLLSHAYELLESLKEEVGGVNFLAKDYTVGEEDLMEEIEEELGDEPEDPDAYEAWEERIEQELGGRGVFFGVDELLAILRVWLEAFRQRRGETLRLDDRHTTGADELVTDLQAAIAALEVEPEGRARFVIG